ncbi:protein kinase domain-containing protein [Streptomyces hyaluromycini]|uniref:protein kinase domain-containing protein n=1 Tax=Streptomyces hyaluromycini TaxID=1377993 RepID=UPI000B5CD970|nr:hypothetical protein [Streptomyces hyaluromycini]
MAVSRGGRPVTGTGGIRKFPTGANYMEALQHPELCFRDPDLRNGTVQQSPVVGLGPKAISGNFASVFSVTARDGQRYALKCFTRDTSAMGTRYDAISTALRALDAGALSQPWSVRFDFLEQGVLALGDWFPVLKMAWVQGTDLLTWIDRNRHDAAAVRSLADRFLAVVDDLESHGIAHGDLQHGNILVATDGTVRLVDYDGMYVPALKGEAATENGHRNYQSPRRTATDFGPAMDRFSAWVIHLSLVAVATDAGLWSQLHDDQGEYLILSESDFKDPATSLAWPLLLGHPDERLRAEAFRVHDLLGKPCSALPRLAPSALKPPAPRSGQKRRKGAATPPVGAGAAATVQAPGSVGGAIPAWMSDRMATGGPLVTAGAPAAVGGNAGPGTAHAATAVAPFSRRRPSDVMAAATALLTTAAPGVLTVAAGQPEAYLPLAQTTALFAAVTAIGFGRRRRPEYRQAKQQVRGLRRRMRELKDPAGAHRRLEQEMQKLDQTVAKDNAATDKRIQSLQTELRDGLARITMDLNRRTDGVRRQQAELPAKEQRLIADALEPEVRAHVENRLRRTSIQDARNLPNMGAKTIQALIDAGIRTAADYTGVSFSQGPGSGGRTAYFVLGSGMHVRVPGIGEGRATSLADWRQSLEQRARASAPATLPAPVLNRIRAEIATLRAQYATEVKQAEGKAQLDRDATQKRVADERQRLMNDRQQRGMEAQRRRADLLQRQKLLAGAQMERTRVTGELSAARAEIRRVLGAGKYLRFVLSGR